MSYPQNDAYTTFCDIVDLLRESLDQMPYHVNMAKVVRGDLQSSINAMTLAEFQACLLYAKDRLPEPIAKSLEGLRK